MHSAPTRFLPVLLCLFGMLSGSISSVWSDDRHDGAKERELIGVLQSDAPPEQKAMTCKQLAVFGSSAAVPALAPLLADEQLASWARIALEAIPGAEADKALREAAGQLQGRLLIGTINSIGVRRDTAAVPDLTTRLKEGEAAVASAAALALGRIADEPATQALRGALGQAAPDVRSTVAEGCILCAERLLAEGKAEEAAAIYDEVRKADVPRPRVLEATRGAILARQSGGIPLLIEQLRASDRGLFQIGLSTARELPGREVTEALTAELAGTPDTRAAALLSVLADRGDKSALPAVLAAAVKGTPASQIAAVTVVRALGDASCIPTLLEIATSGNEEVAQAARATLAGLPGAEVDAEIKARLAKAQGAALPLLLAVVGERRIEALSELRQALEHKDPQVRSAALTALGETVGPEQLSLLIRSASKPASPEEAQVARQALRAACVRMPDREACAKDLSSALAGQNTEVQNSLLVILGEVGGTQALATMKAAATGKDPQLQDTATRLLGEWFSVDAGPVLLELAQLPGYQYSVRAMRGYIRLARQFNMPDPQRAEMCRKALRAASRTAEQQLVLEVIERYPSPEMLLVAIEAAENATLKEEATRAALAIAQKIKGDPADVQKLLARIGQGPVKLEIIKAEYGAGAVQQDVTAIVRRQARDLPLILLPASSYNASFGGDPVPSTPKKLKIQYRINGKAGEATFAENETILLGEP